MSPFTFSAGTITPHRLRKRTMSPKEPLSASTTRVPTTPSAIPRLQRRVYSDTAATPSRAETSSPTKPARVKTPAPGARLKRPNTAPTPRTPSTSSTTSASSTSSHPGPLTPPNHLTTSASLPLLDALDATTLSQLEQLTQELAQLTASTANTPPRKKSVLTRSPRLGNIVEVDTPTSMKGTPCALEARSAEEVLREVGRLGRELRELAW
ncbi:hypothetical protein CALCODRAFT_485468 [Calocera cornea HHB12733]|uniref:Uncharacterized protein n=1 Tax=Calocera cornea HHB12733 TaxID=1353952 RepID=A0A165EBM4_9BASI|nr:hypothetical protein CALCODRAFT_485468 [Calocera cornea HHB12733]